MEPSQHSSLSISLNLQHRREMALTELSQWLTLAPINQFPQKRKLEQVELETGFQMQELESLF